MYQESLFNKLYISNLKNRLHEIYNPKKEDKIRWPMELIQNAKDSLYTPSNTNKQEQVSIIIEIEGEPDDITKVIFSHDGPPFTQDSYEGLMYKISQDKEDNKKTTGKFGTGFLTTHVLSKIVYISGDIIHKDNNITGFHVVMHREGETDAEILDNFDQMINGREYEPGRRNMTRFEYQISTKQSKECAKLGLISLKKHISNVLINCHEIKNIKLIENGKETLYSASFESKENSIVYTITSFISEEKKEEKRKFLLFKNEDVEISVEIDDNYNIIPKGEKIEYLYAVFPLIGTECHILPFSINSPKFEPSTERNNLPLLGELCIDGKITNVGTNRNLLISSIDLYEKLICELLDKHCPNIHELSQGLKLDTPPYESFDLDWYENNILQPFRKKLSEKLTVKSCLNESILLLEAFFPDKIDDEQFFSLSVIKKHYPNLISYNDFTLWKDYIWITPKVVSINDLIEKVQNDSSLFEEPQLKSFNEILSFLWRFDKNLLHNQPLIPNMNNELKCFSNDKIYIRECKKVPEEIIQIIESIEIPWRVNHVNNNINSIQFDEDDKTDAEKKIINKFDNLIESHKNDDLQRFSFILVKFVLKDDEKREKMFKLASKIEGFPYKDTDLIFVSDINPKIWEKADDFLLKKIIEIIQRYDCDSINNEINYIKEFIFVFKLHYKLEPDYVNSMKIIPNGKNELKCLNELFNKSIEFHDFFSPKIKEFFNIDLDEQIINQKSDDVNSQQCSHHCSHQCSHHH